MFEISAVAADYFRSLVLFQMFFVICLYVSAAFRDYEHRKTLTMPGTRQIFAGRIYAAIAIILLCIGVSLGIIDHLGDKQVSPYVITGQIATPLLVLAWGFAYRHRYRAQQP